MSWDALAGRIRPRSAAPAATTASAPGAGRSARPSKAGSRRPSSVNGTYAAANVRANINDDDRNGDGTRLITNRDRSAPPRSLTPFDGYVTATAKHTVGYPGQTLQVVILAAVALPVAGACSTA